MEKEERTKKPYCKPQMHITVFTPDEYVGACWVFRDTGIVIKMDSHPTDTWDGDNPSTGFLDDGFDLLSGNSDIIPSSGDGWYGNSSTLAHVVKGNPICHNDKEYGLKGTRTTDLANPVYFYGNGNDGDPKDVAWYTEGQFGVNKNAS